MRWLRILWLSCLLSGLVLAALGGSASGAGPRHVETLRATGVVNPVLSGYIVRGIEQANRNGAEALIIQLDTPGGLDTSMREIIQATLNSDVPVVVYVSPPGGRAASAGLFIASAAHVAAMAPNTNIGSAHPVSLGGSAGGEDAQAPDAAMTEKVTNDAVALIQGLAKTRGRNVDWAERAVRESVNVTSDEAVRLGVVDLVAEDLPDLLKKLDGREVKLPHEARVLRTADAPVQSVEMNFLERFLHLISDPNIAYILLSVGVYGLIYELASPGAILPGVAGVFALVLAFYSLGTLPINYAGLGLILFAFLLFGAEVIIAPGTGGLAFGGILSLIFGSFLLLSGAPAYLSLSIWVVGGVVLTTMLFFLVVVRSVVRSYHRRPATGAPALLGAGGTARTALPTGEEGGMAMVAGELWRARSLEGEIPAGSPVEVVKVEGLTLTVRRA